MAAILKRINSLIDLMNLFKLKPDHLNLIILGGWKSLRLEIPRLERIAASFHETPRAGMIKLGGPTS